MADHDDDRHGREVLDGTRPWRPSRIAGPDQVVDAVTDLVERARADLVDYRTERAHARRSV